MQKTITITLDVDKNVYVKLAEQAGNEDLEHFLANMLRERIAILTGVYQTEAELEAGYREMAADEERERKAREWSEALIGETLP
jgi:hypothetical protein